MGLFDSLFADAIKKEVDAQLAERLSAVLLRLNNAEHRINEAISAGSASHHTLGLLQGAISTLDNKVKGMREQMQSDEDYTRQLALRVMAIENTDGGTMPDADGG